MKSIDQLFMRRPRVLNVLHSCRLAQPHTQTNEQELAALQRHAAGRLTAIEIGTHQGVSAARIAAAMSTQEGILYCVDPWPEVNKAPNPSYQICMRHLRRTRTIDRIKILRGKSSEIEPSIPSTIDFAFIDGDHTWDGIATDWAIVRGRLARGGVVCLHDTIVPTDEPWRHFGSVDYYQRVITRDPDYTAVETVYSMAIVRRL